jgi:hypothetical protein
MGKKRKGVKKYFFKKVNRTFSLFLVGSGMDWWGH